MTHPFTKDDDLCVSTIRTLSMDAVQKAQSGHPGTAMALATVAEVLWSRHLRFDPGDPRWPDRDRFVLSCGHASALLYSLLHLAGYQVTLQDLKDFRQWKSNTPGHPEHGMTPGVEATTGPLGQGIGNAVGMALAERLMAERFNRAGSNLVDHRTWVLASDGDIMEGLAAEASSLAGHLRLDRLCVIYDDNRITIDGSTGLAFSEDVGKRYEAYGWHVQRIDGMDPAAVEGALDTAVAESSRPSFIVARTRIGYGAPNKQDTAAAHGAPLGEEEVRAAKEFYGWDPEARFLVPERAVAPLRRRGDEGARENERWRQRLEDLQSAQPHLAADFRRLVAGDLPDGWDAELPEFPPDARGMATRAASGKAIAALSRRVPELVGGSADLTDSNQTRIPDTEAVGPGSYAGRYFHFGVREHGMGAILNGMALHGGLRPFGGTFLIFSDYMRPAIRLAAMTELPVVYVFSHDSIGLGEDGPTHQPVEQLASLRAIPGLWVIRPADANETMEAWKAALARRHGPSALILSRQSLPTLDRNRLSPAGNLSRGAYVLAEAEVGPPRLILMASGSEVAVTLSAREELEREGIATRVVSFPCWELFERQPLSYRDEVLPPGVGARLAVEAAAGLGWDRWVGPEGGCVTMERFGASAPAGTLMREFGFEAGQVAARARELLGR
jgi:transketolase